MNDAGQVETTGREHELRDAARRAGNNAYAPYSRFSVGAAIMVEDGSIFTGANVENASLGLTICAERSAATAAVSAGHRRFVAVAIHVDGSHGAPCGACRQFLAEFGIDMLVHHHTDGADVTQPLGDLIPGAFLPEHLGEGGS